MKHHFEERKQNRINYACDQAQKNTQKSDELYKKAKQMASVIPLGQPILVGHHSEQRDRNYRNKIHDTFGKAFAAQDKANYYEEKAESIENNNSIFSDDPNALNKLKQKLHSLQEIQDFMKAANKCIKHNDKVTFLTLQFGTEELWQKLTTPDMLNRKGFAGYSLQNNNANIGRIKKRIQQMEKLAAKTTQETVINTVKIVENMEANRVQLIFPTIPCVELRSELKRSGFRWCRTEGAWQRHYNSWALQLAKSLAERFAPEA